VVPDNAYLLEHAPSSASPVARKHAVVGIAPMPYPFCDPREFVSGHQEIYDNYIFKCAAFASMLVKESYSLEWFGSDVGADASAVEDLRRCLRDRHNVATLPYEAVSTVEGLLAKMETFDYVVTCRFHGVVLAHILNKPILAISHHPKVANLMEQLGLGQYCVDIQTFDPGDLARRFTSLVNHDREVRHSMAENLALYRSNVAAQFDQLFPPAYVEVASGVSGAGIDLPVIAN